MKHRLYTPCVILLIAIGMLACKGRTFHQCQCYQGGVVSYTYDIGSVDADQIKERCLAVQQQNREDSCKGADLRE